MTDDEFNNYQTGRFAEALDWYDRRAAQNKKAYYGLSLYVLSGSGFLAVAAMFQGDSWRIWNALIAFTVAASVGTLGLFKCHENWLSYRATWDSLKRELQLKLAGVGAYKAAPDRNTLFVERIESLMAREGAEWYSRHQYKTGEKKPELPG